MSASLDIFFLDSHTLEYPKTLEGVIQAFLEAGFSIEEVEVNKQAAPWKKSENMRKVLSLAYQTKDFRFLAWNAERQFEVRQYLAWGSLRMGSEERAWIVTTTNNTPYFWHSEYDSDEYSRFFLDLGKGLYRVVQPTFGWIDFDSGLHTTHEDIEALVLPTLYWANFFSPGYVSKIGRDRILSAPAWAIEELTDGGLLYVLASCPGSTDHHVSIESVKSHFGVKQVR